MKNVITFLILCGALNAENITLDAWNDYTAPVEVQVRDYVNASTLYRFWLQPGQHVVVPIAGKKDFFYQILINGDSDAFQANPGDVLHAWASTTGAMNLYGDAAVESYTEEEVHTVVFSFALGFSVCIVPMTMWMTFWALKRGIKLSNSGAI